MISFGKTNRLCRRCSIAIVEYSASSSDLPSTDLNMTTNCRGTNVSAISCRAGAPGWISSKPYLASLRDAYTKLLKVSSIKDPFSPRPSMALQEVTNALLKRLQTTNRPLNRVWNLQCRHYATGDVAPEIEGLERSSFLKDTKVSERDFNPVEKARKRQKQLPPSR